MSDQFRFDAPSDGAPPDEEPDGHDPWAPGGSMANAPIPPAARFFEQPVEEERPRRPTGGDAGPSRNTRLAVAGAIGAVLLAGALWLAGRDDPDASAPAVTPAADEELDEATEEDEPAPASTDVRPPTEVLTGATEVVVPVPAPLPASAVAGLAPAEIVLLSDSGRVRLIDTVAATQTILGEFTFPAGSSMAATDDTVIVWSDDVDEEIVVLRRDQPALPFESGVPVADAIAQPDGEYLLVAADPSQTRELRIDTVVRTTAVEFPLGGPDVAQAHPSGALMVSDEDGVHLLGRGATTLLSTGDVVAANDRFVLYEECDGDGCRLVREDHETGERADVRVAAEPLTPTATPRVLSPDGSALVEIGNVEQPFRARVIELDLSSEVDVATDGELSSVSWAPDGSSFFGVVNRQAVVVDRATGDSTILFTDVDGITSVVVRPAVSSAAPTPDIQPTILVVLTDLTGLHLVAYTRGAELLDIDIDSREFASRPGLPFDSGGPLDLLAGPDSVTVSSWSGAGAFIASDGGDVVVLDSLSSGGPLIPGPLPGTAWRYADLGAPLTTTLELVDVAGERVGPIIELDGFPAVTSDANGAVLLDAAGGVYVADGSTVVRQTPGSLVAAGPTTLYARECDELFTCAVVRIDRATGQRTTPELAELAKVPSLEQQIVGPGGASVSPDGDVVFVQTSINSLGWSMIDVAAGTVLEVPGPAVGSPVVWSDDSRYAVFLSGERLRVFDRDAGGLTELGQLPAVLAFAEAVDGGADEPPADAGAEGVEDEDVSADEPESVSRPAGRRAPTR